jgi:tRNA nucleotidyltransferase (CCA-adding enzyme)
MRIILTHEQTDFDGIASILGAHLIDRNAIPVLPRRMNRNVKAYVTIYGADLPFVDPRDIGDKSIEYVYLVDTQSLTSVKGMHKGTRIHVVDHHSPRSDTPSEWDVRITRTGANVTIFVEEINERDIRLSVLEATLLLLGIYEDTGSLTYSRTTSRDVRAAATLIEQGANLSILNDFLNHPLSLQQQKIYDELRRSAENHSIHGHNLLIARGDAQGIDEELSTIAHKLRDLVDPDAIFLLMEIRGGIQLIARSTNDDIDVAKVAGHFGGGGHPRAAAALIKSTDQKTIYDQLIRILPELVRPAVTVSEIMSRAPQLLASDTSVHEIAKLMQRYGYEGYPVVEDGEILGLVKRRAVDRALSHKLNLTAASLMDAGKVSIRPEASIEELQTLMTNTGWGQIPVVTPRESTIVGIVTRTDLLDTLAPPSAQNGKRNLAEKLKIALPPQRLSLLKEIAEIAQIHRVALYIVGGFVRDLLLDYPSLDFDLVVEGDAIALAKSVREKFGGRVTTHKQFGTAKWFLDHENLPTTTDNTGKISTQGDILPATLDFITARREFYTHPTALPTIESGSIKLDLHRRDFTINTLALRLDGHHYGNLHDYWGGYNDIRHKLVRVLHSISFVDDPTRMLRAVRYEQRYGFQIGKRTLELLLEARPLLSRISGDRVRHEMDNIINEGRSVLMFCRLNDLELLSAIYPDLVWDVWLKDKIGGFENPSTPWKIGTRVKGVPIKRILTYTLLVIRLPFSIKEGIVKRLKLPRITKKIIKDACHLWETYPTMQDAKPSKVAMWLENNHRLAIYSLYLAMDSEQMRDSVYTYVTRWANFKPTISGNDLQARNIPPGPQYKDILDQVKAAWIDGSISTSEEELILLEKLIREKTRH